MTHLDMMGTADAAKRLGVNRSHIPRLVESGELSPLGTLGPRGIFVFDANEIERVAAARAGRAEA